MNEDRIDRVLAEFVFARGPLADPQLEALRAAIFVEDSFATTVPAELLDFEHLGTPQAMRALTEHLLGSA